MVQRWLWRSLVVLAWACPASAQPSPEVARGLAWLQGQVQADGALAGEAASIAAPFQSRAEAALALRLAGPPPAALLDRVASDVDDSTESLARRGLVLASAGRDTAGVLVALRARQNPDLGFGGAIGYESHALDTALALAALRAEPPGLAVPRALAYLRGAQAADGSFDIAGRSDVYVSALALLALRAHASAFDVSATLPRAIAFLQSQQQPGELWSGSVFLTAIAYEALHDFLPLEPTASAVRAFLLSRQGADGSWDGGDPYTTALALRALQLTSVPPFNPTLAALRARVVDAQTDQPLSGVAAVLTGAVGGAQTSGADGVVEFRDLPPGPYALQLTLPEYSALDVTVTTQAGRTLDLGVLRLGKQETASKGTIRGVVTDASGGAPLAAAVVAVAGGPSATTDAAGAYQIVDVAPGPVVVEARKSGYASVSGSGTLRAGGILLFSPALSRGTDGASATLVGTATRGSDGTPLAGVTIEVTGASTGLATTAADGTYAITGLNPGITQVRATLAGFDPVNGAMTVVGTSTLTFSPRLYPTGTTPDGGTSRVSGVVVDAGTGAPIRGVLVSSSVGPSVVTGADGRFTFQGSGAPQELIFSAPGYAGGALALNWGLAGLADIGEVRLMPEEAATLLPDLGVTRIDRSAFVTNLQSLQVSGSLTAFVTNTGNAPTQADTTVTVFEDKNGDSRLDPLVDVVLGSGPVAAALGVGELGVVIQVSGTVAFRDGVLHAVVDSEQAVAESDEDNNTTGFESCESSRLPFIDNFDDGNSDGWQALLGRGTHPGTVVNGEWSRPFGAAYTGSQQWTDYRAEVKLRFPAGHGNDAGIVFRARNPSDFFSLRMQSGLVRLMRFTSAGFSELRSAGISILSHPERYHTLRVDVAGKWARTYINNKLIFEYDALDWEAGAAGVEQDGVLVHWDDFRVSPLTVVEDFNDGDADGWRPLEYGGTPASVVDGEYVRTSYGSSAFGSASWKNYTAEMRLRFPNGASNDGGLVFLAKDASHWAWVTINGGLVRMAVTGQGVVRSAIVPLPDPTGWQTIKAELRGRTVCLFVNGQFLFDYDQLPWENGAVGTIQDGVLVHYDDIKVSFATETEAPDVSASRLVVEDLGSTARFTVRAGLGGGTAPAGLPVAFYGGDPAAGGVLLGTAATTRSLGAGQFEDVSFSFPGSLASLSQVVAVVDDDGTGQGRFAECNEANNRIGLPIAAVPGVFALQLVTDKLSYGPGAGVNVVATLTSLGSLPRLAQVRFVIETADGASMLATLPLAPPVLALPAAPLAVSATWNTGTTLAGAYRVRAELVAPGVSVGAVSAFTIGPAPGGLASARLAADRTSYRPSEVARLDANVSNVTQNTPLEDLRVTTSVLAPGGSVFFTRSESVAQLLPGARRDYSYALPLGFPPSGEYTASLSLRTAGDDELAAATTRFTVESTALAGIGLTGSLVATPRTIPVGDVLSLEATLVNRGNDALAGVPLTLRVIDPETESVLAEFGRSLDLARGGLLSFAQAWTSQGRAGATLVATLSASFGGRGQLLAQESFTLQEPAARPLEVVQRLGREPRVLAYVDCGGHDRKGHEKRRHSKDHDGWRRDQSKDCPTGETLEALLGELGIRHLVTSDEWRFLEELRSGRWNVYALAGRMCREPGDVSAELREAVRRGDGLWVDGSSEAGEELERVLGVEREGRVDLSRASLQVSGSVYSAARLRIVGSAWRLAPTTGNVLATFPGPRCEHRHHRRQHDDDNDDDDDHDDDDDDDDDEDGCCRHAPGELPAIVGNEFGEGRVLAFAFELVSSYLQSASTDRELWKRLLRETLAHLAPEPASEPGRLDVASLLTDVTNGGAQRVEVELAFTLPAGMLAEDSEPAATPDSGGVLRVRAEIAPGETRSFRLLLRLSEDPGRYLVDTLISTCASGSCRAQSPVSFPFEVVSALDQATRVIGELNALDLRRSSDRASRDEAVRRLGRALAALASGAPARAVSELVRATEALDAVHADVGGPQLALARMLAEAERRWWKEQP